MDINNDGFLDLVTVNDGQIVMADSGSRREHIFLNNKGEKFIDATDELWQDSENIGMDDNNIVFLDYDSDGDPDFIISSLTGEDRLLENDGTGKFKHFKTYENIENGRITVKARIHDNKSPNMPQDWKSVHLIIDEKSEPISMTWYGENLWVASFSNTLEVNEIKICATDYSGNKTSLPIK